MRRAVLLAALGLACAGRFALADAVQRERVQFEHGASSTVIRGRITGRDSTEYTLGARAGQVLNVVLEDRRRTLSFNVFAPGAVPGRDAALFIGDTGGNTAELRLTAAGDYVIQVYQVRAAARRGEGSDFTLRIGITAG